MEFTCNHPHTLTQSVNDLTLIREDLLTLSSSFELSSATQSATGLNYIFCSCHFTVCSYCSKFVQSVKICTLIAHFTCPTHTRYAHRISIPSDKTLTIAKLVLHTFYGTPTLRNAAADPFRPFCMTMMMSRASFSV